MIKVPHPGSFTTYGKKTSSVAVGMDNGINFAFALAGIHESTNFKNAYFTEKYCKAAQKVSILCLQISIIYSNRPPNRALSLSSEGK